MDGFFTRISYLWVKSHSLITFFLPFFSSNSVLIAISRLVLGLLFPLYNGGATVIVRGWDMMLFGESIKKYKITILPVVPPVVLLMAKHPAMDGFDFSVSFFIF